MHKGFVKLGNGDGEGVEYGVDSCLVQARNFGKETVVNVE